MTEDDIYLFNEGTHQRIYDILGAHPHADGTRFAVWAPNAERVSVMGDFNHWDRSRDFLEMQGSSGIWEGVLPVHSEQKYKYCVWTKGDQGVFEKADPVGFFHECPPRTASIVWPLDYQWNDQSWICRRAERSCHDRPVSIYEMHLGAWRRPGGQMPTYRDIAEPLANYIQKLGFTHIEFMPLMEHPFYGSWGYQVTGYFAPSHRYGTPQDLMYLIDTLHQHDIGVILDWVPAHFPGDAHGLHYFDGTHLYEHADPRKGFHPDWTSYIFNYGRHEVRNFLLSSAMFWLDKYHIDAIRVDGVASMLYLDYSRAPGEWIPNEDGTNENREAISFLQKLNADVYSAFPGIQTIAEESTAWPNVSRPTSMGGLGFGYKWDLGWMNDTLSYMQRDPVHRSHHQDELTFRAVYAYSENYVLPLSHDEVVHGKGSLLAQMPGDPWQKFANLRLLFGYMYGLPGKKLVFMGSEFAPWREWHHDESLDWALLDHPSHSGMQTWIRDLNCLYRKEPCLHELDTCPEGFEWVDMSDRDNSVLGFLRKKRAQVAGQIVIVCNFTPVPRHGYRVGVSHGGTWKEVLNSDAAVYGGSGVGNQGGVVTAAHPWHGRSHSISITLPPLGILYLQHQEDN